MTTTRLVMMTWLTRTTTKTPTAVNARTTTNDNLIDFEGNDNVFETLLYQAMMQKYKRAIGKEKGTSKINAEVLENWELLVKKDGNTRWYRDAFLKDERVFVVVDAIADFGLQHGIGS